MINIKRLIYINKIECARISFFIGMIIAYFGSLHPWFMWSLSFFYEPISFCFLMLAFLFSYRCSAPIFCNKYYLPPIVICTVYLYYVSLVNNGNINGYIMNGVTATIYLFLFKANKDLIRELCDIICKIMGAMLFFSIMGFILYLVGFNLPSSPASFNDGFYSYQNYYLFMIDDRMMGLQVVMPRFSSIFLEPGHLGSACTMLLMTQIGKWKKWYNIVLFVATFLTFSLAAYVMLMALLILRAWVLNKQIIRKIIIAVTIIASVGVGSIFYNDGDNLIHNLIVMRLEIEDGELAGNNRTTDSFDSEYHQYLQSSDIFFGRDMDGSFGNSGYKVFIYENGIIGLALLILLFATILCKYSDRRHFVMSCTMCLLFFVVRGFVMWYCMFIPIYATAYFEKIKEKEK